VERMVVRNSGVHGAECPAFLNGTAWVNMTIARE